MITKDEKNNNMPVIAMGTWKMTSPDPKMGSFVCRNQILKITKRKIIMRPIGGKGMITISPPSYVEVESLPCNTIPSITPDEKMKKYLDEIELRQEKKEAKHDQ